MHSFYFDPDFEMHEATWNHTRHCLDVIRQRLICAVDDSLMARGANQSVVGIGEVRTSKNFEALKTWASERNPYLEL